MNQSRWRLEETTFTSVKVEVRPILPLLIYGNHDTCRHDERSFESVSKDKLRDTP